MTETTTACKRTSIREQRRVSGRKKKKLVSHPNDCLDQVNDHDNRLHHQLELAVQVERQVMCMREEGRQGRCGVRRAGIAAERETGRGEETSERKRDIDVRDILPSFPHSCDLLPLCPRHEPSALSYRISRLSHQK